METKNKISVVSKTTSVEPLDLAQQIGCKELHMIVDQKSGLKGIVAIYSVKRGPALGGCRFLPYNSTNLAIIDAIYLAKAMALKAAIHDLPLGGGKAVLIEDPNFNHEQRIKALRVFGKFLNTLNGRYITAVDSGTSVLDMDQIAKETSFVTSTSKFSYSVIDPSITTARGVFRGILAAVKFKFAQNNLKNIHVAVQGVGHVGYNLVKLLHKEAAKISICDKDPKLVIRCKEEFPEVNIISNLENIYKIDADVLSPCALGGVIQKKTIDQLKVKIIAGAANNQLLLNYDAEYLHQKGIIYAPDFIINAGGLIHVAGPVMNQTEQQNLEKVDNIYNVLLNVFRDSVQNNIDTNKIAYNMALERLQED